MTVAEAKVEIPDIDTFCHAACVNCSNDWYCPTYCDALEKARKIPFDRILACYARHEGDWVGIWRYLRETKVRLHNEL